MISFDRVSYSYPGADASTPALRQVSFDVAEACVTVVLGSNGSGKSTLVRLANGLLLPGEGEVRIDGVSTSDGSRSRWLRERVGIVFQHPDDQIVATTVEDDVAFGPENLGLDRAALRERVDAALAAVGLAGLERREPHTLSGGQKQRLAIAGALAMDPAFLVLDEPTSMLDPRGRADVLRIVRSLRDAGHGVLFVTHDLSDAVGADRVLVLQGGVVAYDGDPAGLLDQRDALAGWGLELPGTAVLAEELRHEGAPLPAGLLGVEEIAEALWR